MAKKNDPKIREKNDEKMKFSVPGTPIVSRKIENIPGLIEFEIPVLGDNRGWFKENFQKEKLVEAGLSRNFSPVQNNISYNAKRGTTRGLHEEPWNKFISTVKGRIFGAWVDLREGKNFGQIYTTIIDPSKAIFVPEGVANGFQTLEDDVYYSYLVDAHWSPDAKYHLINADDSELGIDWPIPMSEAERSEKDKNHPKLREISPIKKEELK